MAEVFQGPIAMEGVAEVVFQDPMAVQEVAEVVCQGPMVVGVAAEAVLQDPEEEEAVVHQEPKEAEAVEEAGVGCQVQTRGVVVAAAAGVVPLIVVGVMVDYVSAEAPVPASTLREQVVAQAGWTLGPSVEAKEAEVKPEAARVVEAGEHGF